MAISSEDGGMGTVMPVAPMGNFGGGFGNGWGGDGSWLILFILLLCFGGWNNGGGWGDGGMNGVYPWLVNGQNNTDALISTGFQNAAITGQLSDIQNSLTSGFSGAEVTACNRAMDSMQTAYSNQIASMNQRFADVTALSGQLNGLQASMQNCCCQQAANTADLKYAVASEACADRQAVTDALRDVIANNTANTQSILDKLNQQTLDAKNEQIQTLQTQLNMANLVASQTAQTAQLIADNTAQTQYVINRVAPYPIPSYSVANPYASNGYGYGCGCGA